MARDRYDDDDDRDPPRGRGRDRDDDDPPPRGRGRDDDDYDDDYDRPRRGSAPPSYLGPAIAVTLCCCLIGGIIAIVHAAQVNSKWAAGDTAGARKASDNAKLWCWLSFGIGIVTNTIYAIAQVALQQQQQGFR